VWLERSENLGGREARKFGRSEGMEVLEGRKVRQDPLTGEKLIFASSCRLDKLLFR
jgi:hypothetical protein